MKLSNIFESLLNEKDNRGVLKTKLKLSDELAEELHKLSDKYSIWFGNHLKGYERSIINDFGGRVSNDKLIEIIDQKLLECFNHEKEDYQKILSLLKTDNRPKINIDGMDFSGMLYYYNLYSQNIKDWLAGDGNPNIRNISWDEATRLATRWHDNLSTGGELSVDILDDKDEIIHKFDDGFMWVLRKDFECELSKKSMGHCGTATDSSMYLLRLIKGNEEFVTTDWDPTGKYIIQLKGKGNNKPHSKYHKYILWLLLEWDGVKELRTYEGHRPETNFDLSDLTEEEFNHVLSNKPSIMNRKSVKEYFERFYDNKADGIDMLRTVISNFLGNDSFMSVITISWVLEIIRYAKVKEINLVNEFIDKLVEDKFFEKNSVKIDDYINIIKVYNNPIKLMQSYGLDNLLKGLVIDERMGNFLYSISNNLTNKKRTTLVIDYLIKDKRFLDSETIPDFFKYVEDSYKESLINKVKEHYSQKNESLPFTVKVAIRDNSVNSTSEVTESIKITLKRLIK
jgi:hypothetical protein